jgi:hypothetical protein
VPYVEVVPVLLRWLRSIELLFADTRIDKTAVN